MSFRFKLFLFSLLISLVPLLLLGWYGFDRTEKNLRERSFSELKSINQLSQSLLTEWQEAALNQLESLTQRPLVVKIVQSESELSWQNTENKPTLQLLNDHLLPALKMQRRVEDLSIIDLNGKVVVSTDPQLVGQFRDHKDFFLEGLKGNFISSPSFHASSGEILKHVAAPIKDVNGKTLAVLTGHLDWQRASEVLSLATTGAVTLESYLVNQYHFMLTDSRFIEEAPLRVTVNSVGFNECFKAGSGQGIYQDYRDVEVFGVYQLLPNEDICLLTEQSSAELNASLKSLRKDFFIIAWVIGGVALGFAFLMAGTLSRPIKKLVEGAAELGRGQLDYRFPETGSEIGQVQKALNQMAESLTRVMASRDELNLEVENRTRTEQKLKKALVDLKNTNQELEQFAYVASHDLQEPLRTITSYIQLIEKRYADRFDDDAEEFFGFVVEAAGRMKTLINDLLEYSRVGRKELAGAEVNLNDVLATILRQNRVVIEESHAEIQIDPLPTITGIPVQLNQLFQNLIGNAIKFHRPDVSPMIKVTVKETKKYWNIHVSDNGIGIDNQYIERIFTIFQRLHSIAEYSGTGIGLALCKKIVKNHHGAIKVESVLGEGTTFIISLPKEDNHGSGERSTG